MFADKDNLKLANMGNEKSEMGHNPMQPKFGSSNSVGNF